MQSANRLVAETQIVHVFVPLHSAVCLRLIVEFLDLQRRKRRQLDVPDARHNMLVDVVLVIRRCGRADGWLGVVLIPELRPFTYCVIPALRHIDLFEFLHRLLQLLFAFALRPREDTFCDWFPCLQIDTCRVTPLPATILPLADVALPICPFLRHLCSPFHFGNTNNYHRRVIKSSKFLKISDIFRDLRFSKKLILWLLRRSYCAAVVRDCPSEQMPHMAWQSEFVHH